MNELTYYNAARKALQQARDIDEVKDLEDKAEALRLYAVQQDNEELERYAAEIRIRARRQIGRLSKALEKAQKAGQGSDVQLPSSGKSKATALKAAGLTTSRAHRCEILAEIADEEFEAFINKKQARNDPIKSTELEAAVLAKRREKKAKEQLQAEPPEIPEGLFVGDFRDQAKEIPNESIELIFTDPPYDRESIPLFGHLAAEAARVLRPGGSLIAYCGQIQLPEVLRLTAEHLRYWWVNACIHAEKSNQMSKYGIKNDWKPMVWFVKGSRGDVQTFVSDAVSGRREKGHHEWQQAQSEAEYYIERLCSPAGLVWEPFAGGGTTIAACNAVGRRWIGAEIDELSAAHVARRISE